MIEEYTCIFCGHKDEPELFVTGMKTQNFAYGCLGCGARGPVKQKSHLALLEWESICLMTNWPGEICNLLIGITNCPVDVLNNDGHETSLPIDLIKLHICQAIEYDRKSNLEVSDGL